MPRVKGGYVARRRRKKVLKLAKGYTGSKHAIYRTAHEQVMRALQFSYRDRKVRKREFRKLWITRVNAACRLNDISYSKFINGLKHANIEINRKMLADLAVNDAAGFAKLVEAAKKGLENKVVAEKVETVFLKQAPKALRSENHQAYLKAEKKVAVKEEVKSVDLESLSVAELKAMCKEQGIKGYSALKKDELVAVLSK